MSTSTIVSSVSRGNYITHHCFSLLLVADLYIILYDAIREGKAGHGREGLYFGENGEHRLRDIAVSIAEALHDLGVSDSREPTPFDEQDYGRPGAKFVRVDVLRIEDADIHTDTWLWTASLPRNELAVQG
jgi:hypothetical protein